MPTVGNNMILGLDLSTRAAGAIAVPPDWDGDWSLVHHKTVGLPLPRGASEYDRINRCRIIAASLRDFATKHGVTTAWFESYAFSQRTAAHSLGELGGIVRLSMIKRDIQIGVSNMGAARKLLCGHIPRGTNPKKVVQATLDAAGAPTEVLASGDLCDAYVCANWGLSETVGSYCFAQVAS